MTDSIGRSLNFLIFDTLARQLLRKSAEEVYSEVGEVVVAFYFFSSSIVRIVYSS